MEDRKTLPIPTHPEPFEPLGLPGFLGLRLQHSDQGCQLSSQELLTATPHASWWTKLGFYMLVVGPITRAI